MPKGDTPLHIAGPTVPTILVIFGATGDLSRRKLTPAFSDLSAKGLLPREFAIVGFSRGEHSYQSFQELVRTCIPQQITADPAAADHFLQNIFYIQGAFEDPSAYERLATLLIDYDRRAGRCSRKLFYLAVPPSFYQVILQNLADSGLSIPCDDSEIGWTRVLIEKPFGQDLSTAIALDELLGLLFKEEQIFRIDHYLAKETLQNILAFRFSNILFEPLWNARYIEHVHISLRESAGIGTRGAFYDHTGALRDVGQNHLLQMLAIIAMEDPKILDAEHVRSARAQVLTALRPITASVLVDTVYRARYKGYRTSAGVLPDSSTETYFRITAHVDNERWNGVPFIIESGKCLLDTASEITISFKEITSCICTPADEIPYRNTLTFRIQPDEGITIRFWKKKPGFTMELTQKQLAFSYHEGNTPDILPDAYEKILFDALNGDQMLFASTDEIRASWKFITPILEQWHTLPLGEYEPGWKGMGKTES